MEKIEVVYRELSPGLNVYHQFILYTNSAGVQYAASGWPETKLGGSNGIGTGKIVTTQGLYDSNYGDHPDNPDKPGNATSKYHSEKIVSGADLSGKWSEISQAVTDIGAARYNYNMIKHNSNTVVGDALSRVGLPEPHKDTLGPGKWLSPGSQSNLSFSANTLPAEMITTAMYGSIVALTGNWLIANLVNNLYLQFKSWTPPRTDPLVLDLDNDGIETIGIGGTVVVFDHNADGIRTGTGWVKSDDGFLVLDRNDNGTIDSGRELFGVDTIKSNGAFATNGFEALSELDANGDHVFDQNDVEFAHVQVWRDFNQNGISTANELFSLPELGIVSFNLNATTQNVNLGNGNVQTAAAAHLTVDGTGQTGNLDLANNPFYREFVDTIPLTEQALNLPDNKGSGWVRDLREAASLSLILVSQSFVKIQQGILQ